MNSPQNNITENGRQPDPDAIKMFVGQVPRTMDENDLRKMFEEYGPVFQLNVLRDKMNNQSKGCCFVTFYTRKAALDAQNALHNIKTMPGMHHPVQMKPADSEKRNEERKLFIGMLTKKFNENDVKMMFAPFGNIEDCTVLRDQNGQSRGANALNIQQLLAALVAASNNPGCAFVTYANRQSAQNCIKNMHHSQTMEGCSSPLVVKFADTQKEKEQKKLQQMNANLWSAIYPGGGGGGGITNNIAPQYLALLQQAAAAGNLGLFSNVGSLGNLGANALNIQQLLAALVAASNNPGLLAALATLASGSSGGNNSSSPSGNSSGNGSSAAGDASNNMHLQNLQGLAALANAANSPGVFNALSSALGLQGLQNLGQNLGQNMGQNGGGNMPNNMGGMNQMGTANAGANSSIQPGVLNALSSALGLQGLQNLGQNLGQNMGQNVGGSMANNIGGMNQMGTAGGASNSHSQSASLSGSLSTSTSSLSGLPGLQSLGSSSLAATSMSPGLSNSMNGLNNGNPSGMDTFSQAYTGIQQYAGLSGLLSPAASFPNAFQSQTAQQLQAAANSPAGKQTEGPEGANLFIYHLPQEFSDQDLMQTFMPFGNVISAKVFIDKQTNLSKCFGFVSYDNAVSAQAAIQAMNGFQIGMKRLKVQLKRPKSESKPY